ncbi:MAG: sigma 54-interacting transcriptional regulator, partial [Betaproteobacteria bacterium]|nr:sigma 54-interacting transcriptional regulator [Betaproteobacteria bacterium]
PLALQARLLRVLQERQVVPLQASRAIDVDIAVVCATHRNLRQMMDEGAFRQDLYYRLNGLSVRLPALRERSDRAALTRRLLAQFAPGRNLVLSDELRRCVDTYAWPGNVRQLANVLRTACVMASQQGTIGLEHLPEDFIDDWRAGSPSRADAPAVIAASPARPQAAADAVPPQDLPECAADGSSGTLSEIEERLMRDALDRAGGNISEAARQLRVSRNTIYRRLRWRAQ